MSSHSSGEVSFDLLKNIFVPTAIFTALGYFWGWGVITAYWGYLGVSASFVQASISEVVLVGWLELLLAAIALVICFGSFRVSGDIYTKLKNKNWFSKNRLFYFFLLASVSLITGSFFTVYAIFSTFSINFLVLILLLIALGFFWLASILGFHSENDPETPGQRLYPVFKVVFPSFYLYLIIMVLGSIIWLNRLTIIRGIELAQRDTSPNSFLLEATIYTEKPLPISGNFDPDTGLYEYDNLRFVDSNDSLVVVLKHLPASQTSTKDFLTYVLDKDKITLIEFQP